jgi:Phage portal protein/Bacterial CdiA-CT RNAse A domain
VLDNSARPSGALVYGGAESMPPAQFDRLKRELEDSFQGARNAGRPLLLEGGLDWKAMSLSPRDMDFIALKQMAAREIALALGVPPLLLGIPGDNTYANYAEANRTFWRQTVIPLSHRLAKSLSRWLFAGEDANFELRCDLDNLDALAPDREALWARLDGASFLTQDEKRAAAGYGAVADAGAKLVRDLTGKYRQDQPRTPAGNGRESGRWVDGGGASGEGVQLAQTAGERQYSVNLKEEELKGGHTIRDHVGKSDSELLAVVQRSIIRTPFVTLSKKSQSSFASLEAANDFVNRLLEENMDKVDAVASGKMKDTWLERRFGYPTGKEAFRPGPELDPYIRPTYNAGVFILHAPGTTQGYRVLTAYPTNDNTR